MDWYYAVKRQQFGPVDEEEIRRLVRTGRIKRTDLVWNEGMGDKWSEAGSVSGLFDQVHIPDSFQPRAPRTSFQGTAGQTPNEELVRQARACLSGRWGLAIAVYVIYSLIMLCTRVLDTLSFVAAVLLGAPLMLGLARFYLLLARMEDVDVGQVFSGFPRFVTALAAHVITTVLIVLWSVPSAISWLICIGAGAEAGTGGALIFGLLAMGLSVLGIAAVLRYSQVFYILADDPNARAGEAVSRSKALMKGQKVKLFLLGLRFIGWWFLCMLTCGLGVIFVGPYVTTAMARFYDDLVAEPVAIENPNVSA
jgi:uncharacterized membrane protein